MEILDLSGCTTHKQVSELITQRVKSANLNDLTKELGADFVYHEEATRKLYTALATGNNAILYGPGGYGKSVLVKAFCHNLGIPVICKVGYKGMTPEELLGVPNMTKLLNDSTYEIAFENSVFACPGILLLEEFFDADPSTAAALKDVLTEKGFRDKDSRKESLISSVVITGNKTPEEVATDQSTAAFYQDRFPFRHNMVWKSFEVDNYLEFFQVYFKDSYRENYNKFVLLAQLCSETEKNVSPRIAKEAGDVVIDLGVDFLDGIEDIDTSAIERFKYDLDLECKLREESEILDKIDEYIKSFRVQFTHESIILLQSKVLLIRDELGKLKFSEDNMTRLETVKSRLKSIETEIGSYLRGLDQNDEIDELFAI
jgi:MoxR-like ATPase